MNRKSFSPVAFLPAVLALLLALGVNTVFSACGVKEDGTWMRCHSVQDTVTVLAIVLTGLLTLRLFLKNRGAQIILAVLALLLCAGIMLVPEVLMPLCMLHTMRCYTLMMPFVRILAALIAVFCAVLLVRSIRKEGKQGV